MAKADAKSEPGITSGSLLFRLWQPTWHDYRPNSFLPHHMAACWAQAGVCCACLARTLSLWMLGRKSGCHTFSEAFVLFYLPLVIVSVLAWCKHPSVRAYLPSAPRSVVLMVFALGLAPMAASMGIVIIARWELAAELILTVYVQANFLQSGIAALPSLPQRMLVRLATLAHRGLNRVLDVLNHNSFYNKVLEWRYLLGCCMSGVPARSLVSMIHCNNNTCKARKYTYYTTTNTALADDVLTKPEAFPSELAEQLNLQAPQACIAAQLIASMAGIDQRQQHEAAELTKQVEHPGVFSGTGTRTDSSSVVSDSCTSASSPTTEEIAAATESSEAVDSRLRRNNVLCASPLTRRIEPPREPLPATRVMCGTTPYVSTVPHAQRPTAVCPERAHLQRRLVQLALERRNSANYAQARRHRLSTSYIKLDGFEPEDMHVNFPQLLREEMHRSFPHLCLAGVAVRRGCVLLTLDVVQSALGGSQGRQDEVALEQWLRLLTGLAQQQAWPAVSQRAITTVQVSGREMSLCAWEQTGDSHQMVQWPVRQLERLRQSLAACQLCTVEPYLITVPSSLSIPTAGGPAFAATVTTVILNVLLHLPPGVGLNGWTSCCCGTPVPCTKCMCCKGRRRFDDLDVKLTVRDMLGNYLPLEITSVRSATDMTTCKEDVDKESSLAVQVAVSMNVGYQGGLRFELWATTHLPRPNLPSNLVQAHTELASSSQRIEVMVADLPLLVVCDTAAKAAQQLREHVVIKLGDLPPRHLWSRVVQPTADNTTPRAVNTITDQLLASRSGGNVVHDASGPSAEMHTGCIDAFDDLLTETSLSVDTTTQSLEPHEESQAASFLEDMGLWLTGTTHPCVLATSSEVFDRERASAISQIGDDLLVYAVQQGLGDVAQWMVRVLETPPSDTDAADAAADDDEQATAASSVGLGVSAGEQQQGGVCSSTAGRQQQQGGTTRVPRAWLLRAAMCLSATGADGVAADSAVRSEDGDLQRTSILHAAMTSENPAVLALVLSWGRLYGGADWSWPWKLEDCFGCTPLHVAAAQSPETCHTLLRVIDAELPVRDLLAARLAWRECTCRLGISPKQLLYAANLHAAAMGSWSWPHGPWSCDGDETPVDNTFPDEEEEDDGALTFPRSDNGMSPSPFTLHSLLSPPPTGGNVPAFLDEGPVLTGPTTALLRRLSSNSDALLPLTADAATDAAAVAAYSSVVAVAAAAAAEPHDDGNWYLDDADYLEAVSRAQSEVRQRSASCSARPSPPPAPMPLPEPVKPHTAGTSTGSPSASAMVTAAKSSGSGSGARFDGRFNLTESQLCSKWTLSEGNSIIQCWAVCMSLVSATSLWRSYKNHMLHAEWLHLGLHGISYLPMIGASAGFRSFGGVKLWMSMARVCDALGFFTKWVLGADRVPTWQASQELKTECIYILLLVAVLDQSPMPDLLILRAFETWGLILAYQTVGTPHAVARAVLIESLALVITLLSQLQQRRTFRRWYAARSSTLAAQAQQQQKQRCREADVSVAASVELPSCGSR